MLSILIMGIIEASCLWEAEGWTLGRQHLPERSFQPFPAVYLHSVWMEQRLEVEQEVARDFTQTSKKCCQSSSMFFFKYVINNLHPLDYFQ